MNLTRLSQDAIAKVGFPAWEELRDTFFVVAEALLDVSPTAVGSLTTIYVKFYEKGRPSSVYAVVWIRTSKRLTIGLSLPESFTSEKLSPPPRNMTYKGLTKYFKLVPGDEVPAELREWVQAAYDHAVTDESL